ncbi:FadR/GntR family transcriptional regulator [Baekduia soli]|nr:FadR/GntR family transcriptional regulator [Baekduia soli]
MTRIKKAHQHVYEQLRGRIASGALPNGARLPSEAELAGQFGVSRGTMREALRALEMQHLVHTTRGVGGGNVVTTPTVAQVTGDIGANIMMLWEADDLALEEFLEVRGLLEVYAARQSAKRRTPEQLDAMRRALSAEPPSDGTAERISLSADFHMAVLAGACNSLLTLQAAPIYMVLKQRMSREPLNDAFGCQLHDEHRDIYDAIRDQDSARAARLMRAHLNWQVTIYRRIWSDPPAGASGASGPPAL